MPLSEAMYVDEILANMEMSKELFGDEKVAQILIGHLSDLVKIGEEERSPLQVQMMELIISLVRNVILIPFKRKEKKNLSECYKENIQAKIYTNFASPGGIFDALIYLCQDMGSEFMQKMSLTFLEIFYLI